MGGLGDRRTRGFIASAGNAEMCRADLADIESAAGYADGSAEV